VTIGTLHAALGDRERVFLDSSVLITFHKHTEQAHYLAKHLLDRIAADHDPLRGYYSAVSATELLVRPLRTSIADFTFMHQFLVNFPHLLLLPVDLSVALQAATIRAASRIRLPDALIIASALLANCEVIVSNDAQWQQRLAPLFPEFHWLYLSDHL
jgi:predicted nucleic acid-binding protein